MWHLHKHTKSVIMALMLTFFSYICSFHHRLQQIMLENVRWYWYSLVLLILNGTTETKLSILPFFYWAGFAKNSIVAATSSTLLPGKDTALSAAALAVKPTATGSCSNCRET